MRARERTGLLKILANPKAKAELRKQVAKKYPNAGAIGDGHILQFILEHYQDLGPIIAAILKMFSL